MNNIFKNPFEIYSENKLIIFGSLITTLFSYVAFLLYFRMDGLMDIHFADQVLIHQPLLDNFINILTCSILLYALGLYLNKKTRFIDILATSIIARVPLYPLLLLNINNILKDASKSMIESSTPENIEHFSPEALTITLIFALLALAALVWYMILLYKGFKTATNSKGNKPIALFIIMVLIIEITSKFLIHSLNY